MPTIVYTADAIKSFCQKEDMQKLLELLSDKWNGVVIYATPGIILRFEVYHEEANMSDIWDAVRSIHPEYTMDSFYKGRYGYFVEVAAEAPESSDVIFVVGRIVYECCKHGKNQE